MGILPLVHATTDKKDSIGLQYIECKLPDQQIFPSYSAIYSVVNREWRAFPHQHRGHSTDTTTHLLLSKFGYYQQQTNIASLEKFLIIPITISDYYITAYIFKKKLTLLQQLTPWKMYGKCWARSRVFNFRIMLRTNHQDKVRLFSLYISKNQLFFSVLIPSKQINMTNLGLDANMPSNHPCMTHLNSKIQPCMYFVW